MNNGFSDEYITFLENGFPDNWRYKLKELTFVGCWNGGVWFGFTLSLSVRMRMLFIKGRLTILNAKLLIHPPL